jgi:hypothetical protein
MKTAFSLAILAVLLVAPGRCFALWFHVPVSKERAKAMGIEVRSTEAGANQVQVELEFKTKGALKRFTDGTSNFNGVQLRVGDGDNLSLTARLQEDRSKPGQVVVGFTADRAQLDKLALWVYVPGELGGAIYELRVKGFIEPKKGR